MTSRERLLTALEGGQPDRLPVTTHHLMPFFLDSYLEGATEEVFFRRFGLDPVHWAYDVKPDETRAEYWSAAEETRGWAAEGKAGAGGAGGDAENVTRRGGAEGGPGDAGGRAEDEKRRRGAEGETRGGGADGWVSDPRWIVSDEWRIESSEVGGSKNTTRYDIHTPGGTLSMVLEHGPQTDWVLERPIKDKSQVEIFQRYAPWGVCDTEAVGRKAEALGGRGILRGGVPGFQIYGQPGCWQDAVELFGLQELIMETMDDPLWVKEFLGILRDRKRANVASMEGASFDLIELGGGSASSTVISPKIFQEFVAPYDQELIQEAHRVGQKVVYHTCGGMMPILELIADMGPDAMETFTPPALGGDTRLAEAKERIGSRVCMIGGFDQFTYFQGCTPEDTRKAVRRCFEGAGGGGGFILAPSDHFFHAELELLSAFGEEARSCRY